MEILVDMDGVLADFDGSIKSIWKRFHPNKSLVDIYNRKTYYLADSMPESSKNLVSEIYTSQNFFLFLPIIDGSKEALEYLISHGHTVRICTSPIKEYRHCVSEKFAWVERHLGEEWIKRLIITKDKTFVRGDILIDDKPQIKGELTPTWEHIIFDNGRAYNKGVPSRRYINWKNFRKVLGI
jgi:5'-nucleotidase